MVKVKFTKGLLYEGFQYGAGDIAVVSEGEVPHLYGVGDAEPQSNNLAQENFGLPKVIKFKDVQRYLLDHRRLYE